MNEIDYAALCAYAQAFSQLDKDKIDTLHHIRPQIQPHLGLIIDDFYDHLSSIPKIQSHLQEHKATLQQTHRNLLKALFISDYGVDLTQQMYEIGNTYINLGLPAEFIAGSMSILQSYLINTLQEIYHNHPAELLDALIAINSAIGFSLLVMQESYQTACHDNELERFLSITGMSRNLFENMARAYR